MTKPIPKDVKVYEVPLTQLSMITLSDCCMHQSDIRIPMYIITEKQLNPEIMRRAVEIETERNDALRLVYFKKQGKLYEYFAPSLPPAEIPFRDFKNGSAEDLTDWLKEDAAKPLPFLKGQTFRIKLFRTFDNKYGVYAVFSHASMDLYGILAFFSDLMYVYDALENGTDLPQKLSSFEEVVCRQLEIERDSASINAGIEFFKSLFEKDGPSFYAGIDAMRQLNITRKRKKDPKARYIDLEPSYTLNDKSATLCCHIDRDLTEQINEFCLSSSVSLQNLVYIAMRTYLSKINEYTDDVYFNFLLNRRATLKEKSCGGTCASLMPLRTVISKDKTFSEALCFAKSTTLSIMRYANVPSSVFSTLIDEIEHRKPGASTASVLFTVCPSFSLKMPDGWNCDLGGVSTGYFPLPAYAIILPSPCDGGLNFWYEYRSHDFTEEDFKNLHEGTLKVIKAGLDNPDITIEDLLNKVL